VGSSCQAAYQIKYSQSGLSDYLLLRVVFIPVQIKVNCKASGRLHDTRQGDFITFVPSMTSSVEIPIHSSQTLVALLLEFRLPTSSPAQPGRCYLKGHNLKPAVSTILLLQRQVLEDCEQEGEIGECQFPAF
jgi:hypothetical protein